MTRHSFSPAPVASVPFCLPNLVAYSASLLQTSNSSRRFAIDDCTIEAMQASSLHGTGQSVCLIGLFVCLLNVCFFVCCSNLWLSPFIYCAGWQPVTRRPNESRRFAIDDCTIEAMQAGSLHGTGQSVCLFD